MLENKLSQTHCPWKHSFKHRIQWGSQQIVPSSGSFSTLDSGRSERSGVLWILCLSGDLVY